MTFDLSTLPQPEVIEEKSLDDLTQEWLTALQSEEPALFTGVQEPDPLWCAARLFAAREFAIVQDRNTQFRAQLLSGASGADLEGLGATPGVQRLVTQVGDPNASPPVPTEYETDASFRRAINTAPRTFGTGSRDRYERAALASDLRIESVFAAVPNPADLDLEWLPRVGVDPLDHPEIETNILNAFEVQDDDGFEIRMLTDTVSVTEGAVVSQDVTALLHCTPATVLQDAIDAATAAITAYAPNVRAVRSVIAESVLLDLLTVEGVLKADLTAPAGDVGPTPATGYEWGTITITAQVAAWL